MRFSVQTDDLISTLSIVTRAVPAKAVNPALEGLLIEAAGNQLTVTGSDGNLTMTAHLDALVEEEGTAALPGKLLHDMTRRMPAMTVDFDQDGNKVKVKSGPFRAGLTTLNAGEYPRPKPDEGERQTLTLPSARLRQMINRTAFAMATDPTRIILTGMLFEVKDGTLTTVSLDGFRLAEQETVTGTEDLRRVVPGRAVTELERLAAGQEGDCTLTFCGGQLTASFGPVDICTTLLTGEYMDWRKIIPDRFATQALVNREALLSAVERASIVASSGKHNLIRVLIRDESITVRASAEIGTVEEGVDALASGAEVEIAFNTRYMTDVLKSIGCEQMIMGFNGPNGPCVMRPKEGADGSYLVLSVRVM